MTEETKQACAQIKKAVTDQVTGKTKVGFKYALGWMKQVGKAITADPNRRQQ